MAGFVTVSADLDLSGREVDLVPSGEALPGRVTLRLLRPSGLVLCLVGAVLAAAGAAGLASNWGQATAAFCVVLLAALACFAGGIHFLALRREWDFAPDAVTSRSRGILGRRSWREPLSAYRAVLARQEYRGAPRATDADVLHIVELKHSTRRDRDVRLYCSSLAGGFRAKHAHYARLFGLPAVRMTAFGEVACPPDEMEATLREGARVESAVPPTPPRGRLTVRLADGVLTIRTRAVLGPLLAVLAALATVYLAAFMAGWLRAGPMPGMATILWPALPSLACGLFVVLTQRVERLEVSGERLRYRRSFPLSAEVEMQPGQVESVTIEHAPHTLWWRRSVRTASDDRSICFGASLSGTEKEWLRDTLADALGISEHAAATGGEPREGTATA